MTSVAVVAHARKKLGGGLTELRSVLADAGIDDPLWFEVPKSKYAPKCVRTAIDEGADLLFVWGGDGMVQRCIDAVGTEPVVLAILPAGTGNLLAHNLGIPIDLEQAVEVGLHGARRTIDVGRVNGERFAVMAGTGLDALDDPRRRPCAQGPIRTRRLRVDRGQAPPDAAVPRPHRGRRHAAGSTARPGASSSATSARCSVASRRSTTPAPRTDCSSSA